MCGGSTLESTSKRSVAAPAPAPVVKPVVEKLNVAKVDYLGKTYYVKYRPNGKDNYGINAVEYVQAGQTSWSRGGTFAFRNMNGFTTLKTLPNALRKAS